jgi:4-oxalocrotonate tautomerase
MTCFAVFAKAICVVCGFRMRLKNLKFRHQQQLRKIKMPLLNVKLNTKPDPVVSEKVALFLTDLTAHILHKKPAVTAVQIEYITKEQWFIGGKPNKPTFSLDIKITSGTNTKGEMKDYLAAVYSGMEGILGQLDAASYTVIHELRADSWGYAGLTQEFRYVSG